MKQKHANRPNWQRIIEKRYAQEYIQNDHFEGDVSYLLLDRVQEPLMVSYAGEEVCIADHGFTWLMFFPKNHFYSLTVILDEKDEVVQWYYDVIKSIEYSKEGIPIINDLYLDLVYLPDGKIYMLDEDELDEALEEGVISQADYDLAKQEAFRLYDCLSNKSLDLINEIDFYIERLKVVKKQEHE